MNYRGWNPWKFFPLKAWKIIRIIRQTRTLCNMHLVCSSNRQHANSRFENFNRFFTLWANLFHSECILYLLPTKWPDSKNTLITRRWMLQTRYIRDEFMYLALRHLYTPMAYYLPPTKTLVRISIEQWNC